MSCAVARNCLSACTYTRYERLLKSKSFTYDDPMNTPSVSVICDSGTCRLFAFSRSIVTRYCGSFAVNEVNSRTRSLRCPRLSASDALRCLRQFLQFVRSLILHHKLESAELRPVPESAAAASETRSLRKLQTCAAECDSESPPRVCASPLRCEYGFSGTKMSP